MQPGYLAKPDKLPPGKPWLTSANRRRLRATDAETGNMGGVHFKKGCYIQNRQEIIARHAFLGQLKKSFNRLAVNRPMQNRRWRAISNGERNVGEVVNILQTGPQAVIFTASFRHNVANGAADTGRSGGGANLATVPADVAVRT